MASMTEEAGVLRLNAFNCVSLSAVTNAFGQPISEEHAFALLYQALDALRNLVAREDAVVGLGPDEELFLDAEGRVHANTFRVDEPSSPPDQSPPPRSSKALQLQRVQAVEKVVSDVALLVYSALDFGCQTHVQRQLSPELEHLFDVFNKHALLKSDNDKNNNKSKKKNKRCELVEELADGETATPSVHDTDDEGIEIRDEELFESLGETNVSLSVLDAGMRLCARHLSVASEAASHFRNVCRALVSEAIELTNFLARAKSREQEENEGLRELALQDWAMLWIHTMQELRQGVKLKKTHYTKTPIEFELTPYEILMEDIRSRRYKLNKVMVDGEIPPRVKKDAHDVILEFIRSRPPLKPASRRKLPPPRREATPQERLMESIRSKSARESLKKIPQPKERNPSLNWSASSSNLLDSTHKPLFRRSLSSIPSISPLGMQPVRTSTPTPTSIPTPTLTPTTRPSHVTRIDIASSSSIRVNRRSKKLLEPDPNFLTDALEDDDQAADEASVVVGRLVEDKEFVSSGRRVCRRNTFASVESCPPPNPSSPTPPECLDDASRSSSRIRAIFSGVGSLWRNPQST